MEGSSREGGGILVSKGSWFEIFEITIGSMEFIIRFKVFKKFVVSGIWDGMEVGFK